jgi:hypothetical protein
LPWSFSFIRQRLAVGELGSFGGLLFILVAFAVGAAEAFYLAMPVTNAKVATAEALD